MNYEMKPLSCSPAKLKGLSEQLIVSHYENNYGGAVKRLNAITAQLASRFRQRSSLRDQWLETRRADRDKLYDSS